MHLFADLEQKIKIKIATDPLAATQWKTKVMDNFRLYLLIE